MPMYTGLVRFILVPMTELKLIDESAECVGTVMLGEMFTSPKLVS